MAEIFGAVASGAGLLSLSIELIESVQKLKSFYDASKNAPETVAQLCFDLETMSLSLRQLEQHQQQEIVDKNKLLARCVETCSRMVAKIQQAVSKIERVLQQSRMKGRVYMAFKDPEIRKLLSDMEHAKTSMSLAYMSYCQ